LITRIIFGDWRAPTEYKNSILGFCELSSVTNSQHSDQQNKQDARYAYIACAFLSA
jgi:hypothetical protein